MSLRRVRICAGTLGSRESTKEFSNRTTFSLAFGVDSFPTGALGGAAVFEGLLSSPRGRLRVGGERIDTGRLDGDKGAVLPTIGSSPPPPLVGLLDLALDLAGLARSVLSPVEEGALGWRRRLPGVLLALGRPEACAGVVRPVEPGSGAEAAR